jgi:hypothetical protein
VKEVFGGRTQAGRGDSVLVMERLSDGKDGCEQVQQLLTHKRIAGRHEDTRVSVRCLESPEVSAARVSCQSEWHLQPKFLCHSPATCSR